MYENLRGKKLLVVGSDPSNMAILDAAKEMGIYTIVVDGITDWSYAPAKRAADEGWDINYSDTDAVVQRCVEAGVDGVLAGYSEFRVLAACRIAKKLGTPFYATEEQIELTRSKRKFKDACMEYGIPIPRDYCFSYPMGEEEKRQIEYPVIVKPADYAGRKGISVCYTAKELDDAVEYAASMSQSKTVIVEDYLEGIEFASVYTLSNGAISLSCMNDKYITDDQERKTGLCEFLISPSGFYQRYLKELDEKIRNFIKGIHAENGVVFFQGMITKDKIYVFEMGYRINGNNDFLVIEKFNNINFMKMMIAYSLCGDMCDDLVKDNPLYGQYAATLLFYAHEGTVGRLEYDKLLQDDRIRDIDVQVWLGKEVHEDGSTGQCAVKMKLFADDIDQIVELIKYAQNAVVVEDTNGKNMLFKPFDAETLLQ